jgi:hypothetical protein
VARRPRAASPLARLADALDTPGWRAMRAAIDAITAPARRIRETADAITAPVRDISIMMDAALFTAPTAARDVGRISEQVEPRLPETAAELAGRLVAEQRTRAAQGRALRNREEAWTWASRRWQPSLPWKLIKAGQREAWRTLQKKKGRPRKTGQTTGQPELKNRTK